VEEAYLLAKYARGIDPAALLVLGEAPLVGEDETFKNGFTIRAEKCPNKKGVAAIVSALGGGLTQWTDLPARLEQKSFGALWITGGYGASWHDEGTTETLALVPTLIVQDLFASPLWDRATYQLPGGSFAEREGSYVNHADRLQSFKFAIRPPSGVMTEGRLYWRLLNMPGLYNARRVLDDIAREILYFSAATSPIPAVGMDLKVNMLAEEPALAVNT
jgi:NADH-quinone oxidoreductase subunit G